MKEQEPPHPYSLASAYSLEGIREGIERTGVHWVVVQAGSTPRWGYSVGLTERGRPELVLAGSMMLSIDEVMAVLQSAAAADSSQPLDGGWTIAPVDRSWSEQLLLAPQALYGEVVDAVQVMPPTATRTIDVPDLSRPWNPADQPAWQWLDSTREWGSEVPIDTMVVTDPAAARGALCASATRFDTDDFEIFALGRDELRALDAPEILPLTTLLAHDPTLEAVLELEVGGTMERADDGVWRRRTVI